ncbi:hypothetical protein [Actinotalea subterranea]|uniref:hypothetical protein n=1 Tax=Actinotalea subterranea TaxID=2607497 RepID=UPI0011EF9EB4|nr:hypothetical protein [Actinotalea subterranea]
MRVHVAHQVHSHALPLYALWLTVTAPDGEALALRVCSGCGDMLAGLAAQWAHEHEGAAWRRYMTRGDDVPLGFESAAVV